MKRREQSLEESTFSEVDLKPTLKELKVPKGSSQQTAGTQEAKGPTIPSPDQTIGFLLQFALRNHQYVNDFIKLADQKAAFVFTLSSGLLVLFYQISVFQRFTKSLAQWSLLDGLYFIAVALLVGSSFCAFWAVKPRLKPAKPSGLVFWESVASFADANEYLKRVLDLSISGVVQELLDHHYRLSHVCKRKYTFLNISILCGGVGVILSMVLMIFGK